MSTLDIIEVSKELGVSTRTIRTYLKNGRLTGKIVNRKYEITVESIRNFKEISGGALKAKTSNFQTISTKQMVTVDLNHYEGLITRKTQLEGQLSNWEDKEQKLLEYQNTNSQLTNENECLKGRLKEIENKLKKEREKGFFKRVFGKISSNSIAE